MKDILFKDVPYFTTFYLYGIEYLKVGDNKANWVEKNLICVCDPDNLVEIKNNE